MNELLKKIEQEVLEEFSQKLNPDTNDAFKDLAIQMARISASITKAFIEKYEQEKSL